MVFLCGAQVSVEELKSLLGKYSNTESLAQSGVTVGAKKYMFLSSTDRVVRARKGTSGVHCIKTVQGEHTLRYLYLPAGLRIRSIFGRIRQIRILKSDPDPGSYWHFKNQFKHQKFVHIKHISSDI